MLRIPLSRKKKLILIVLMLGSVFMIRLSIRIPQQPQEAKLQLHIAPATNCTLYVSTDGSSSNTGSYSNPLTLSMAQKRSKAGDVICLLDGEYIMSSAITINSGNSGSEAKGWIVYKAYHAGKATLKGTSTFDSDQSTFFHIVGGGHHVEIRDLRFDGVNVVNKAVFCQGNDNTRTWSHHVRVINNVIINTGASGIASKSCDYTWVLDNKIHNVGYNRGWSSGISLNSQKWVDKKAGFHSYVINNLVSGVYDCCGVSSNPAIIDDITDGNGIIIDRGGNTPPTLIANNLVYQNGGRCIHIFFARNAWIVNNTCYKNSLDLRLGNDGSNEKKVGEYTIIDSYDNHHINNISVPWRPRYPFQQNTNSAKQSRYIRNIWFGDLQPYNVSNSIKNDRNKMLRADPLFIDPPYVNPDHRDDGQFRDAIHPEEIGNRFALRAESSAINAGIDPRTLTSNASIRTGMTQYLLTDLAGNLRSSNGTNWDLGAYEYITNGTAMSPPVP